MTAILLAYPPATIALPNAERMIELLASIPAPIYTLLGTTVGLLGGILTTTIAHRMTRARDNQNWVKTRVYENVLVLEGAIVQLTTQPPGLLESAPRGAHNYRTWQTVFSTWDMSFAYDAMIKTYTAMRSLSMLDFLDEYQDKKYQQLLDATRHFYMTLTNPLAHVHKTSRLTMNDFLEIWNNSKDDLNQKTNDFIISLGGTYWLAKTPAERRHFQKLVKKWDEDEN